MNAKKLLLIMLCLGAQAFGAESTAPEEPKKKGGVSASSFSDVECSMSDYSCYSLILEQGKQEALGYLLADGTEKVSTLLSQAMQVYRQILAQSSDGGAKLSDEEIIYLLAVEDLAISK